MQDTTGNRGQSGNDSTHSGHFEASYIALQRSGELSRRAESLWSMMGPCRLCPRKCGADRLQGEKGFCGVSGTRLDVSSFGAHFGEERPLVGLNGSGTIFLSHCGLRCVFCQNWEISIAGEGMEQGIGDLAGLMLSLQESGCHNINVVTPTHYAAHILKALDMAAAKGLRLPLVWNTSGWERLEVLALLDGVVDIYMPDFKYWDADMAAKYSALARSYPPTTRMAILEMYRQVGHARYAPGGIMQRGLIIRHLVLPNDIAESGNILEWIAAHLPKDTYINIMAQYHPEYRASEHPEISRKISAQEYSYVVDRARSLGLSNLDVQTSFIF